MIIINSNLSEILQKWFRFLFNAWASGYKIHGRTDFGNWQARIYSEFLELSKGREL